MEQSGLGLHCSKSTSVPNKYLHCSFFLNQDIIKVSVKLFVSLVEYLVELNCLAPTLALLSKQ